jgi:hypothetical protein
MESEDLRTDVEQLKIAQATQVATTAGAQATLAATQAGLMSTIVVGSHHSHIREGVATTVLICRRAVSLVAVLLTVILVV